MSIITKFVKLIANNRLREIEFFRKNPIEVQHIQFKELMEYLSTTNYGASFNINKFSTYRDFCNNIPIIEYNDIDDLIYRMRKGESNILVPDRVLWYAKSSGTTETKSKFIPVPKQHLYKCHYQGTKDVIFTLTDQYPELKMFSGKALTLGGSYEIDEISNTKSKYGDLSAILIQNAPFYSNLIRVPSKKVVLTADFDKKIEAICRTCIDENITSIAGVPSWNLVMLNKILEYTGKSNICEVWENMEVFMHGGVSFVPYENEFKRIIPSSNMKYIETYNASEGFFSIQDEKEKNDMLLMLDYGIFYEFLAISDLDNYSKVIPLEGVEVGVNYCMIISTWGGLWRYLIGDTVIFTSKNPYKIKITGRTKLFINVFGEEVIIDNADKALSEACRVTNSEINEYTAGPIFMEGRSKGGHQWLIEFRKEPSDINLFRQTLDKTLQNINSDYESKRFNSATLVEPVITVLSKDTFFDWMDARGKIGGQNKVPRLSNMRQYIDSILDFVKNK